MASRLLELSLQGPHPDDLFPWVIGGAQDTAEELVQGFVAGAAVQLEGDLERVLGKAARNVQLSVTDARREAPIVL